MDQIIFSVIAIFILGVVGASIYMVAQPRVDSELDVFNSLLAAIRKDRNANVFELLSQLKESRFRDDAYALMVAMGREQCVNSIYQEDATVNDGGINPVPLQRAGFGALDGPKA